jgi:hypothetical protein
MTGKIAFGALYGAAVIALYAILEAFHGPQFYDKLLCVPILNLMVRPIEGWNDRLAARFHPLDLLKRWGPAKLNVVHMSIWIALFAVMWFTGFIGRGLWLKAPCENDTADACLAYGKLMTEGNGFPVAKVRGAESFGRACNLGVFPACEALTSFVQTGGLTDLKSACDHEDPVACFLSGWVLARGAGVRRDDSQARPYLEKACSGGFAPACAAVQAR